MSHSPSPIDRRRFLGGLAMLGVAGRTLLRSGDARAALAAAKDATSPENWPSLPKRTLGRTGFQASRLVFGCGAALSRRRRDALLETALEAGINVFDVGARSYYKDAEKNLAPFLKRHRNEVFLISKSPVYLEVEPNAEINSEQAKQAAATWTKALDQSLSELGVDHVDAYYLMASYNPSVIGCDEIAAAFARAKQAGKVQYLGLSTHQNAERVLTRAIETGIYSLATLAITPAGWYDWAEKGILKDTRPLKEITPLLDRARAAGMGLIGMKAGRYLAGRKFLGWGNPTAFDEHYDEAFLKKKLSAFQRSYAYVLAHGLDAVNADMQSPEHLAENVAAAATNAGEQRLS